MKKMLLIIFVTTLLKLNAMCPATVGQVTEHLRSKAEAEYMQLAYIEKLRYTFRIKESGFNYTRTGRNGEIGAYQIMPSTWKLLCNRYLGRAVKPSPHYQDSLVFCELKRLVMIKEYTMDQVAAFWNSGNPDSRRAGINKAGVPYDVGAYVNDFRRIYKTIDIVPRDRYDIFFYTRSKTLMII